MQAKQRKEKIHYLSQKKQLTNESMKKLFIPPLQVYSAGSSFWPKGHSFKREYSDLFGIELVKRGVCELIQANQKRLIKKNEVYILHKDVSHQYTAKESMIKRLIVLDGPMLKTMVDHIGLNSVYNLSLSRPCLLEAYLKKAMSLFERKPNGFEIELSHLAYQVLFFLGQEIAQKLPEVVQVCLDYIQGHTNTELRLEKLAEETGYSVTHLNREFNKSFSMSPSKYHQQKRMDYCKFLLKNSEMTVQEIAYAAGYSDPLHFSRQFKRLHHMSPKVYRLGK